MSGESSVAAAIVVRQKQKQQRKMAVGAVHFLLSVVAMQKRIEEDSAHGAALVCAVSYQ
jgi:hypothetical protein